MNYKNHSPWIEQLDKTIHFSPVSGNSETDIVIIGGGISGVSTAYFLLTQTELSVTLLEGKKIARGATGHNAGQVVLYFEKPFQQIVTEYGLDRAIDGQKSLFQGFDLLGGIDSVVSSNSHIEISDGYMGIRSLTDLIKHIENKFLRDVGGAQFDAIMVDKNWTEISGIPSEFLDLISFVDQDFIQEKLETREYFPVLLTSRKACANSALVCQDTIQYLLQHFPHRFSVHEESHVSEIRLIPDRQNEVWVDEYRIRATEIILCTNGFEHFRIVDLYHSSSYKKDAEFHKNVHGLIGYMAGFFAPHKKSSSVSYYPDAVNKEGWESEKYFYITRRTITENDNKKSLICVGGPDDLVPSEAIYDSVNHDPRESYSEIQKFLRQYRTEEIPEEFPYAWHGLMGYTHTGIRYIGQDPHTPHLWYNLGCNGVGIVGSVFGGWKIAKMLSGTSFKPSIFDPQ